MKLRKIIYHLNISTLAFLIYPLNVHAQNAELKSNASFCKEVKGAECLDDQKYTGQINGVKYRHYSDGSGSVEASKLSDFNPLDPLATWSIGCRKNVITGVKRCIISRGDLRVVVDPQGRQSVTVSGLNDAYPGSRISIRLGDKVFRAKEDDFFSNSKVITSLMKDGVEMATEYFDWPFRSSVTSLTPELYGFQEALQLAIWSVKNLR